MGSSVRKLNQDTFLKFLKTTVTRIKETHPEIPLDI